ncbi:hypothetical protein CF327_g365 [Tilletia walkeri]|uniref:NADP-dependent oxidoreductase domain-containing protein n=1 Tax=Tilletia walkeri TaxID=117179 RepID=A0A8X7N952_9BASI|nr:hypothetical protein CF327_g365 [Tilletia walkeri]KAE8269536.1 hypothetical protein A4X09_0g2799 [Tilletia walkeri]
MASPLHEFSNSGKKLPAIGLGTMGMAAFYGTPSTQERVNEVLSRAIEKGCLFWDTANVYSAPGTLGDNERQIGSFFRSNPGAREKVFIASKFAIRYAADGSRSIDGSREWCLEACKGSLEAIGIDQFDLYYIHRPSENAEIEETIGAMKELKDSGKIKYIGVSEFTVEQLERAEKVAHIDAFQIEISPWTPEVLTNGMLEWCEKNGTTVVAYSPLGRGFLTGRYNSPEDFEEGDFRRHNPRFQGENFSKNLELVRNIEKIASKKGCTSGQITLAWVLSKSAHMFVIPGTTNPERLVENIEAGKVELSPEESEEIDGVINSFKAAGSRYAPGMKTAF